MKKKTEMYCAFVKGNAGQWAFPVEAEPSFVKSVQDDGIRIFLLEGEFVRTDTMKSYGVYVKGTSKTWLLSALLEGAQAEELRNGGVLVVNQLEEAQKEIDPGVAVEKESKSNRGKSQNE